MSVLALVLLLLVPAGCGAATPGAFRGQASPAGWPALEATRVVDPGGRAGSDCRPADPCPTLARAAEVAQAGDVVVIRPGTYRGDVVVQGAGSPERPIVFAAEQPGTVVVQGHIRPAGWQGDGDGGLTANGYVTWRGLTVRNHADGAGDPRADCHGGAHYAFRVTQGWRIEDSLVEGGQSGVRIRGHGVVIERTTFQDLARFALLGARVQGLVIRDSVIRRINTGGVVKPACSAVTKLLFTDGVVFEGNQSYDNVGPGFWLDWDNTNFVVRHNVLRNNRGRTASWEGPGLWIEGNPGANGKVYGNTFADNTGAGLGLLESVGVEVYANTFAGNPVGIELRNMARGANRVLRDLVIHDNTFNSWRTAAVATSIGSWAGWSPATHHVVFDRNTFMAAPGAALFFWLGRRYTTLAEVQSALGAELSGQVVVSWPRS